MQIQVNTDRTIEGHQQLIEEIEADVTTSLKRFAEQITRIEVHLNDENSHKSGPLDIRCMLECRLAGMQPVAVTHHADSKEEALSGATGKLVRLLEKTLGKLRDSHGRESAAGA